MGCEQRLLRPRVLGLLPHERERLAQALALGRGEGGVFQGGLGLLEEGFHFPGEKADRARLVDELLDLADRGVVGGAGAKTKLEETAVDVDEMVVGRAQEEGLFALEDVGLAQPVDALELVILDQVVLDLKGEADRFDQLGQFAEMIVIDSGEQGPEDERRLEGVTGGFQRVHARDVGFLDAGDVARAEENVVNLARARVRNIAQEMGKRGIAQGGGEVGGAEGVDGHGKENIAHHHGHIAADSGRAIDLAQAFLDELVEGRQASAALGLVDNIVVDQDEGVEQFEGQRGPEQRAVLKRPVSAKDAVGAEQQQGADAFTAPGDEFRHVEVERLK